MIFIKNDSLVKRFYLFFYQNKTKFKKRKNSLETQVVLLIFSLELEISGVAENKSKQKKMAAFSEYFLSEDDFEKSFNHFLLLLLWCQLFWGSWEDHYRLKRLSQIILPSKTVKKDWSLGRPQRSWKSCRKCREKIAITPNNFHCGYMRTLMPKFDFNKVALQLYWKRTLAWVFSCIHSGSEMRINSVSSVNKLHGIYATA